MKLMDRVRGMFWRGAPPRGAQVRRFQAARIDRLTADWLATTQSINEELRGDLDRLRARGATSSSVLTGNTACITGFCG